MKLFRLIPSSLYARTQLIEADVVLSQTTAEAEAALDTGVDFAFLDVDVLDGTTYAFAQALIARKIPFAFLSASSREQVPDGLRGAPFVAKPYTPGDIAELLQAAGKY